MEVATFVSLSAFSLGLGTRKPWLGMKRLTTTITTMSKTVIPSPTRSPFSMKNCFQLMSFSAITGLPFGGGCFAAGNRPLVTAALRGDQVSSILRALPGAASGSGVALGLARRGALAGLRGFGGRR